MTEKLLVAVIKAKSGSFKDKDNGEMKIFGFCEMIIINDKKIPTKLIRVEIPKNNTAYADTLNSFIGEKFLQIEVEVEFVEMKQGTMVKYHLEKYSVL